MQQGLGVGADGHSACCLPNDVSADVLRRESERGGMLHAVIRCEDIDGE